MNMNTIEITGQPCSGKSTYVDKISPANKDFLTKSGIFIRKIYFFILGVIYLKSSRIKKLLKWSLKERAPVYFRLNIFRNAIIKFGMFKKNFESKSQINNNFILDEGISHLPFLFLETETTTLLEFIINELCRVNVIFLKSPGSDEIKARLQNRGHKRLQFISLTDFVDRNKEIEKVLIHSYSKLCLDFKVI